MGSVYQRGPGNFWVAFRINGRRRYWRGFATFEDADRVRTKIAADLANGNAGIHAERNPVLPLGDLSKNGMSGEKRRIVPRARTSGGGIGTWPVG